MKFEWLKLVKNPKNLLLFILALASIFISLANVYYAKLSENDTDYDHIKAVYNEIDPPQNYAGEREAYKLLHHTSPEGKFLSAKDQKMHAILIDIIYLAEDENTARNKGESQKRLELQTQRLKLEQEYLDLGGAAWANEPDLAQKIARNEQLQKHKLPIVDLGNGQQGFYFIYYLLNHWMNFFIVILIACFFFDFLSAEYENRNHLLMFTQPISKRNFYWRKYLVACLSFIGLGIFLLVCGFLMASVLYGTGDLRYPILITKEHSFHFISLGSYLARVLLLQLLFIALMIGYILFLARVLRRSLEVFSVFMLSVLLPNIITAVSSAGNQHSYFWPFNFMNVTPLITFPKTSLLGYAAILISWNLVLLFLWKIIVRREKI